MERKKWTIETLPPGYPKCKRGDLNDAVKDLSDELISKSINNNKDLLNVGWKDRIMVFVQLGHSELQRRNNTIMLVASSFSLLIALIAIFLSVANLLTSSDWKSSQIKVLDEQKQIQQQILGEIRANPQFEKPFTTVIP